MEVTLERTRAFVEDRNAAASTRLAGALETVAVLASPAGLYRVLGLRGIGPPQLPDPSMHTTFILEPHDIFVRYQALFSPTSRLREAGRVGFLVLARLSYLLFGALPGFFVFRYVLALIAIGPLYLLLKRLYGRWAGFVGIAVVMSSPVVVTAWGTDYPDSAAVSYLLGGLAALALSLQVGRRRIGWLAAAGGILVMSVWSIGVVVPLVAVTIAAYLAVRVARDRAHLARDVALLIASAILVTGLLAALSKVMIGQFDFITPTLRSARQLSTAAERRINHSASSAWVVYDSYLLIPPAIVLAYIAVFVGRCRGIGTSQLFIGLTGAVSLGVFAFLQFVGSVETLEIHYFSTTLWSSVTILLAVIVAELTQPIVKLLGAAPGHAAGERRGTWTARLIRWIAQAVPALLVLAVAMAYEIHPYVMVTTWGGGAGIVAVVVVLAALAGRLASAWRTSTESSRSRTGRGLGGLLAGTAVVVMLGAALLLTVARPPKHAPLANTVFDPIPAYSTALNGSETRYVAEYAVDARIPGFVGHPTYPGEILLTWEPSRQFGDLLGPMGLFHNAYTWVSGQFPVLTARGAQKVSSLHAAQILLMSLTGEHFEQAVRSLGRFQPVVVRRTVISYGSYHLHAWLVDLKRYIHPLAS
jgi:hypothetical protein